MSRKTKDHSASHVEDIHWCNAQGCQAEATHTVRVSVDKASDETRRYCESCYDVYCVGVQHATKHFEQLVHATVNMGDIKTPV